MEELLRRTEEENILLKQTCIKAKKALKVKEAKLPELMIKYETIVDMSQDFAMKLEIAN